MRIRLKLVRPFVLQRFDATTAVSWHCLPEDYEVRNARRMSSQDETNGFAFVPICRCARACVSLLRREREISERNVTDSNEIRDDCYNIL